MFRIENGNFKLRYFLYEVVHHCNLKCKGCDHCAPLASPEYVDLNRYEKDMKRMSELFPDVRFIGIMGGEPLLHPQIIETVQTARQLFPKTDIKLYTNGILLPKKDEEFWKKMNENNIKIIITVYDIGIDYKKIIDTAKKYNVTIYSERKFLDGKLPFDKIKFDIKGKQYGKFSHFFCRHAGRFPSVEDGKLYKCTLMCAVRHFNEYFGTDMKLCEKDYIDIHKDITKEELIDYFKKDNPFCKYCNVIGRDFHFWARSKKDIKEWT